MKRTLYILTLLLGSILFTACPYSSEVPLDERPNIPVSEALLGQWELRSSTDYIYMITAKDTYTYHIEKTSKSSAEKTIYEAFFSKVNNIAFLNIYETGSEVTTYYFYRFNDMGNGRIQLEEVTDNIDETFTSSRELRNYFTQHTGISFFYGKDVDEYLKVN